MAYERFCSGIAAYCAMTGETVVFSGIDDRGKYIVRTSDEKEFTGNSISKRVTVRYGDGHQHQFVL